MESKKINQLATEMSPAASDLTIIGDPTTGVSKKVTLEQISSLFAGAVSFYTNYASFPVTGVVDTIYCAKDTQKLYLWSGSTYVEVFPSQALLNTYQLKSEKGNANGYASLDSGGKVPISQLPSSIMEYKGTWSAATNTPTLSNGTGDTGDVYICNAAGSVNFGAGSITFAVGDYVIYSGSIWQRSSGAVGTVTSVALSSSTSGVTIGSSPITTSGTITLDINTASGSQNGLLSSTDWSTFNNKQAALSFTAPLVNTSNTISIPVATSLVDGYLDNLDWTNFNTAYNNMIVSAAVTGTTTKTLTLTQQDAGTITASWTDDNTDAVTSVFGRTGAVVAVSGDYNTSQVTENTNLYFTDARARAALSFTAGSGAYNSTTGVITIPTNNNQITNGSNFITLTSLSAGTGISYNNTTGVITNSAPDQTVSLTAGAGISISGSYPSFTIASTITQYTDALARAAISLTTTGTSGAATYNSTTGVLNVPQYQSVLTNPVTGTGTTNYLPKFTGASTIGNSQVFDNGTNVGIGTTSPNELLSLNATGNVNIHLTNATSGTTTNDGFKIGFNTSLNAYLLNKEAGSILFYTTDTLRATLDASGNLGLGVTPSAWGTYPAMQILRASFWGAVDNSYIGANYYFDGSTRRYINSNFSTEFAQVNGEHRWYTAPSGTAGNAISFTQAMTLFSTGNLAVGTTTDAGYKLDVNGTGRFSNNLSVTSGGLTTTFTGNDITFSRAGATYITATGTGSSLYIGTNNVTDRLVIASTGAATFSSSVTALNYFSTAATTSYAYSYYENTGASMYMGIERSTGQGLFTGSSAYATVFGSTNATSLQFGTNGIIRATITSSGNVGIGTSSPTAKLDIRSSGLDTNVFSIYGTTAGAKMFNFRDDNAGGVTAAIFSMYNSSGTETVRLFPGTSTSHHSWILPSGGFGIGTTSPSQKLEVAGVIRGEAVNVYGSTDPASTSPYLFSPSLGALGFGANGSERMRITSGGNVGIGTTSPAVKFEVAGSGSIGYFRNPSSTAATTFITVVNANNTSNGLVMAHLADGKGYLGTQNSADLQLVTGDSERMRITSGGIINTTSRLNVNGAGDNSLFSLINNGTTYTLGFSPNATASTSTTLTITTATTTWIYNGTGTATWTLPNPSGTNQMFWIKNAGTGVLTLNAFSGTNIINNSATAVSSITIAVGATALIQQDGNVKSYQLQ